MVVKFSRSQRRHDRVRLNKRTKWLMHHIWYSSPEHIQQFYSRTRDNFTNCSCSMCGNPRRHNLTNSTLTMQELKAKTSYEDQLADYFDS